MSRSIHLGASRVCACLCASIIVVVNVIGNAMSIISRCRRINSPFTALQAARTGRHAQSGQHRSGHGLGAAWKHGCLGFRLRGIWCPLYRPACMLPDDGHHDRQPRTHALSARTHAPEGIRARTHTHTCLASHSRACVLARTIRTRTRGVKRRSTRTSSEAQAAVRCGGGPRETGQWLAPRARYLVVSSCCVLLGPCADV